MKIYNYHPVTGEYLSATVADESPLEEGILLIPAFATDVSPPQTRPLFASVFANGKWIEVADHRGEVWFDALRNQHDITDLGVIPDPAWVTTLPSPTSEKLSADARSRRDALMASTAWRYERHARELRISLIPTDDIVVLDIYMQALADLTKQAGFPESITWPVAS